MEWIGNIALYVVLACGVIGCVASIIARESALAQAYMNGLYAIGHIFVAIAGIFASIPYIVSLVESIVSPLYSLAHIDPSLAITSILAIDMGGYQVAMQSAESLEGATMAMFVGFMAGATIVFSIPVGLRIIPKAAHKDFALGIMVGFLGIPFGVLVSCLFVMLDPVLIRDHIATQGKPTYLLDFSLPFILWNLIPLAAFCLVVSLGLYYARRVMLVGFYVFGFVVDMWGKVFLALLLIEHFSGGVSYVFGGFPFDPVFADESDTMRALEIAGYTGLVLSGTFVLCALLNTALKLSHKPNALLFGGILACASNVLAAYPMLANLSPKTRIQIVAFSVCGGFLIGDHLSFSANFQPSLIVPIMLGKLAGALLALCLARFFVEQK
ncbi:ethanolamine utilization protein EutH [Helicobacter canis]|uniref:Ethanolamine utilization protein EutH n=1 Tax=Helicobacter canis TaxID=29419 RepID=A0A5M9QHV8_9HELI|nr:ethanolamine utilization protein EutH [Helicobacter canis]KAA8707750.1 ethanolamine utilization protein EutH [Helicobacter canis]